MTHSPDYVALTVAEGLIHKHEGTVKEGGRHRLYRCTSGKWTAGIGRNLEDVGLSDDEVELMLANDIAACSADLSSFYWWSALTPNRKAALLDLRFCVGPGGFRAFRKMIAAIESQDWAEAGRQILDSKFAKQTGQRARDLSDILRDG